MTAIELLLQRQSTPFLISPAPNKQALEQILAAGMRVPDHGSLQPWHFTVITADGLQRLSDLFVASSDSQTQDLDKIAKKPFRAPMIVVISTRYTDHEKVPLAEQLIAAGCCAHAMQMAAYALGYGAVWRTGGFTYNSQIKQGLAIADRDDIVGFLYIGTQGRPQILKPTKPFESNVSYWK